MDNLNNCCTFEGRTTQNQKYSQVNGPNGPIDKVVFSISVPRVLTSQQKQDPNVQKNDFVTFSMIGAKVKVLQQYFPAGTPIKIRSHYQSYETIDNATGQKKYNHIFEVEEIGFVVNPAQSQPQNNNNGNGNGNYQNQQNNQPMNNNFQNNNQQYNNNNNNNFMNPPQNNNQPQNNGNFQMFGDTEFPF